MTQPASVNRVFLTRLQEIVGSHNLLTDARSTERYRHGYRSGGGHALAVVLPQTLLQQWRVLQACVAANKIVIMQAANTGLTEGSTPSGHDYDREVVIISTRKLDKLQLINNAEQVIAFPGSTLHQLEKILKPHGREPHSVIGSSCIGASVMGGICNNSGGSLIKRGPAYTELALYAQVDAERARTVVLLTEAFVSYPNHPASIAQDQVDLIVQVEEVGDPAKISAGAIRLTSNPRELLIARQAANVIEHSGYFNHGFSLQTGTGGAALAVSRFLEEKMRRRQITAGFALGGITGTMVDLHEKGLVEKLLDTQSFDADAAQSLSRNPHHIEISANQYASPRSKGAACERLNVVMLSALEIDLNFNVNVMTGSDGVLRGASGGHSDTAAGADLTIITAPLVRGRLPTVVDKVLTTVTPGESIDVLVTDYGIAVNPRRPEIRERLHAAGLPLVTIEQLHARARLLTGEPKAIEFTDRVVAVVRYRDGSVIDVIRQVKP